MTWKACAQSHEDIVVLVVSIDSVETHTLSYGYDGATFLCFYPDYVPKPEDNISIGYLAPSGNIYNKVN